MAHKSDVIETGVRIRPDAISVTTQRWPYKKPFRITGHTSTHAEVMVVTVSKDGAVGQGEAAGVRYLGETLTSIVSQLVQLKSCQDHEFDRQALQALLPRGGARNAVDCALWDLEAKLTGRPVWDLAGVPKPTPLKTVFTCGADTPEKMAESATEFRQAKALKIKLIGDGADARRVLAIKKARPDTWLAVDANQGFNIQSLQQMLPVLVECDVKLIEQPLPIGRDTELRGIVSPIPIAADESVQDASDIAAVSDLVQVINIKLDKCGGLTEGLRMAKEARGRGLDVMVGCMGGSSLAMAPGFVLGQLCDVVDLDSPALLSEDRVPSVEYKDGLVWCPEGMWG